MNALSLQLAQLNTQKIVEYSSNSPMQPCLCQHCMKVFETPYQLKAHLLNEFELNAETLAFFCVAKGLEEYSEPSTPLEINDQKGEENKPETMMLKCPNCEQICKGHKGLNQHLGRKHSKKRKNSTCKQCGKCFRQKYALKFHINQVHQDVNRVICGFCNKAIYNKYALLIHISKRHSNIKT
ncbi:unnamed protein product [Blepharisma stoltei]|uniref:C2H2-type domain-containing protein n=1 Tax=Blepharisma stoltei TaxID=1481888 RepID=A0AAU9J0S7_9CILI|nr:unnamed protein product [Blepharisma stoltei]